MTFLRQLRGDGGACIAVSSRCPIREEAFEYEELSQAGEYDDAWLSYWPPRDVEVECFCHVATLRLVQAIDRLVLHYLYANMIHHTMEPCIIAQDSMTTPATRMTDNCMNTKDTWVTVTSLRGYCTKIHTNSIIYIVYCKLYYCADYNIYVHIHCNFICALSDVIIKTVSHTPCACKQLEWKVSITPYRNHLYVLRLRAIIINFNSGPGLNSATIITTISVVPLFLQRCSKKWTNFLKWWLTSLSLSPLRPLHRSRMMTSSYGVSPGSLWRRSRVGANLVRPSVGKTAWARLQSGLGRRPGERLMPVRSASSWDVVW